MFSLNVPLPPAVGRLADDLQPKLSGFDRVRDRHTLVCKRFGVADVTADAGDPPPRPAAHDRLRDRLRPLLASVDPFAVAVVGIDAFEAPASGSGPVVYLDVESDALVRLHRRLCADYGTIEGVEGPAYVPHVTLARGGDPAAVSRLVDAGDEFGPVRWRVHALDLYDAEFREVAATLEL
ncbi:2'-5' RNA ligase family protein [Halorubrum sp. 48-1-W]|uniref:2'-5' RNA ligase family protein n=1 Tax=Halorubrum sp. 48-1-W TaxID=2249761 RepID=UPI000DCCC9CB|nr:2'-5' RNA ligase family protein [Halorubrum sp. 48-1-W]RAW45041.1 2'-5' RNA ligase family protein [Halorubrum sp. 48-1-W]